MLCFLFYIIMGYKISKNALDGCPGIEKEGRFQRRKAMGSFVQIQAVIHGSPIGKPYPSSVAFLFYIIMLRSLDFSNLANWNIWVAKGREINRDPVSSGERERIGEELKDKERANHKKKRKSKQLFFARFHSICCGLDDGKTSKLRLSSLPTTEMFPLVFSINNAR